MLHLKVFPAFCQNLEKLIQLKVLNIQIQRPLFHLDPKSQNIIIFIDFGYKLINILIFLMLSIPFAKLIHCPAEVFAFPSLLPMIPGMFAYKTVLALVKFVQCKDESAYVDIIVSIFKNGLTTTFIMFALVVGVAVPMFIFHKQSFSVTRILKLVKKG